MVITNKKVALMVIISKRQQRTYGTVYMRGFSVGCSFVTWRVVIVCLVGLGDALHSYPLTR